MISSELVTIRSVQPADLNALSEFYFKMPKDVRNKFQPHPFEIEKLREIYHSHYRYKGYIALCQNHIVGYVVVYSGHFDHDINRISTYSIHPDHQTDCQFAPLVSPNHHGQGIGQKLFDFAKKELNQKGILRIFLWGGVKADNYKAIRYYEKLGFTRIGSFEYHGWNHDMVYRMGC